jgi:hypothetical protein
MAGRRGEGWGRKIEAALDRFDFDQCIAFRNSAHGRNDPSASGDPALLFPGEAGLRRLASKLLRQVADDPAPSSHACAAGLVALKHEGELRLLLAAELRAA